MGQEAVRESDIQPEILLASPDSQARLLRNNVGRFKDKTGRWVHYGVGGNGGSDLIGPTTITITPEMVGRQVAVFTACEVKRPGAKPTEEQTAFLSMVHSRGGIACVATSIQDFQGAVSEFISRGVGRRVEKT